MEKEEEKVQEQPKKSKMEELDEEAKKQGKKVNKSLFMLQPTVIRRLSISFQCIFPCRRPASLLSCSTGKHQDSVS